MVYNENHVFIEGNLVKDPELRQTPNGKPVCTFTIASDRRYKVGEDYREEVSYVPVETWSALAESCAGYLIKGQEVRITGRLRQNRWKNSEGENRERLLIVANQVRFGRKPQSGGGESGEGGDSEETKSKEDDLLEAV